MPDVPAPGTVAVDWAATAAPGCTANVLDAVAGLPPTVLVAVIVKLPVLVIVTAWLVSTPFTNAAVVIGAPASVPVEVSVTVFAPPLKLVTVLLPASRAVIRILKLE